MNKWDRMLADGIDISRVKALKEKEIRNSKPPVQLPIPYEPPATPHPHVIPITVKNWMSQEELGIRSKNVMEFIRKQR